MKNEHCGCSSFKKRKRAELTSAKPWRTLTALGIDWDEIREAPHGGFACRTTFFYHGTSLQYIRLIAPVNSAIRRFVYSGLIILSCILSTKYRYPYFEFGAQDTHCPVRPATSRLWRSDIANMGKVEELDYSIKPENVTPQIPTSEWPLLLKNYDKRE